MERGGEGMGGSGRRNKVVGRKGRRRGRRGEEGEEGGRRRVAGGRLGAYNMYAVMYL